MPIGAVAANTLSIKASHLETGKQNPLKISEVSNTLLFNLKERYLPMVPDGHYLKSQLLKMGWKSISGKIAPLLQSAQNQKKSVSFPPKLC